jgi:hypothetical protein
MAEAEVRGVFINCPFDSAYKSCHRAVLLSVVACGLQPRSALESGTTSVPRMKRVSDALRESSFSIHDLTRAYGDPSSGLARFNMPFEFGMAFLLTETQRESEGCHDWLGLLPDANPHGEFISDLAGYDLVCHDGRPDSLIPPVLAWLSTRNGQPPLPPGLNPSLLCNMMHEFEQLVEVEEMQWRGHLPWSRLVDVARDLVGSRVVM